MRIFKDCEFKKPCPICGKQEQGDAMLRPIRGTEEGNIVEAELVHVSCLKKELRI